jgi:hypothetical protein
MKKRRADDVSVGNSVYQLEITDSTQAVQFALNSLVGRGIEPCGIRKHRLVYSDLFQNSSGFAVP